VETKNTKTEQKADKFLLNIILIFDNDDLHKAALMELLE
jgi:hypothetical protein